MAAPIRGYWRRPSASRGEGTVCAGVFVGSTTFDRADDRVCRTPRNVSLEAPVLSWVTTGSADAPTDDWVIDDEQIREAVTGGTVPDRSRESFHHCLKSALSKGRYTGDGH